METEVSESELGVEELVLKHEEPESESGAKLSLHPKRQGDLEEASTLASVIHALV